MVIKALEWMCWTSKSVLVKDFLYLSPYEHEHAPNMPFKT